MSICIEDIKKYTNEIYSEAVDFRRKLHMHPELSQYEEKTAKAICVELDKLGIEYKSSVAGHGVYAVIYGQSLDRAVGIRADIDALPLTEKTDFSYASRVPGAMHACGHDIHTAILLGSAKVLSKMKNQLKGSVSLFFQPSEETIGGARQMIEAGCLDNPKVDSVIGLHVNTALEAGKVEFIPGSMNAASTEFYVTVTGKSCHGAHPAEGIDALLPACAMVSGLQSIVTRRTAPTEAVLITVGHFNSGTKGNIISGKADFSGIIRSLKMSNIVPTKAHISRLCQSIATAYGASCKVDFVDSYPAVENDPSLLQLVKEACDDIIGRENVSVKNNPSLEADDFSYFCHWSRGCYYNLGAGHPGEESPFPLHSDRFNPDEECIRTGILTEVAAVFKILDEGIASKCP